jgi:hypothetical protein
VVPLHIRHYAGTAEARDSTTMKRSKSINHVTWLIIACSGNGVCGIQIARRYDPEKTTVKFVYNGTTIVPSFTQIGNVKWNEVTSTVITQREGGRTFKDSVLDGYYVHQFVIMSHEGRTNQSPNVAILCFVFLILTKSKLDSRRKRILSRDVLLSSVSSRQNLEVS